MKSSSEKSTSFVCIIHKTITMLNNITVCYPLGELILPWWGEKYCLFDCQGCLIQVLTLKKLQIFVNGFSFSDGLHCARKVGSEDKVNNSIFFNFIIIIFLQ